MLKARALFYAIVVSLLIALLSGLLISLAHLQRLQSADQQGQAKLIRNTKSAIALIMGNNDEEISPLALDLFGNGTDSVMVQKTRWGLFTVAAVRAFAESAMGRDSLARVCLIGEQGASFAAPAIYLADRAMPLTVLGTTSIKGTAVLPKQGFNKTANWQGIPFRGNLQVPEPTQVSVPELPFLNDERIKRVFSYYQLPPSGDVANADTLSNSFLNPPLVIAGSRLYLNSQALLGNIVVKATQEIVVGRGCRLEDVLLLAPKITFEPGFEGAVQAFAHEELTVSNDCKLTYPSVVGLLHLEQSPDKVQMKLEPGSLVEGLVISYPMKYFKDPPFVHIAKGATVKGQVCVKGNLELKGVVQGSVACDMFVLNSPNGLFQNYLLDATIDRSLLPAEFAGAVLSEKPAKLAIAKWIE